MTKLCTKRPAEPIYCRLGCREKFGGLVENLIKAEVSQSQWVSE